jgi:hypothetical protein
VRPASRAGAPVIFNNHIARSTLNYQFTREWSIRTIVDYNAVLPNPALVRLANDKRLGIDTLLTYQAGPTTAVYLGYTSGFQNVLPTGEGQPVQRIASPSTLVGRQLLLKISYLIRT